MIDYLDSVCDDEIDEKDVREIFSTLDVSGDRTIDLWEFKVILVSNDISNAGER